MLRQTYTTLNNYNTGLFPRWCFLSFFFNNYSIYRLNKALVLKKEHKSVSRKKLHCQPFFKRKFVLCQQRTNSCKIIVLLGLLSSQHKCH